MTALSLANLGVNQAFPTEAARPARSGVDGAQAFADAMARQTSAPDAVPPASGVREAVASTPAASDPQPVSQPQGAEANLADRERVRRTLGLDGVAPTPTAGDTILGGLQKLRGVFDARQAHLNDIMSSTAATPDALMAMQMEIAQYTIMVDVSSKMTGKASSSLDTLMKGQ